MERRDLNNLLEGFGKSLGAGQADVESKAVNECLLGMVDDVALPARQANPKRLKRCSAQQFQNFSWIHAHQPSTSDSTTQESAAHANGCFAVSFFAVISSIFGSPFMALEIAIFVAW